MLQDPSGGLIPTGPRSSGSFNLYKCILIHFISHLLKSAISVYCIFEGDFDFSHFKAGYSQPSSLLYVGSTAVGVTKRHLNLMAMYRRLKTTEFVDAELSLRFWASRDNLFDFVIVPLLSCADY